MMTPKRGPIAAAFLLLATVAACGRPPQRQQPIASLEFLYEHQTFSLSQAAPGSLPFQAATLALTCTNTSDDTYRGPAVSGVAYRIVGVTSPDGKYHAVNTVFPDTGIPPADTSYPGSWPAGTAVLQPGESIAKLSAWSGDWSGHDLLAALFPCPGDYELKLDWSWGDGSNPGQPVGGESPDRLKVQVVEPSRDEAPIVATLAADRSLASAMLSPLNRPHDRVLSKLDAIIDKHPRSTYADYARFALARTVFPEHARQGLSSATAEDMRDAAAYLEAIDYARFAYAAEAMAVWRRILHEQGSPREQEIAARLDREFPDYRARLQDLAQRTPEEEWKKLVPAERVRDKNGKRKSLKVSSR